MSKRETVASTIETFDEPVSEGPSPRLTPAQPAHLKSGVISSRGPTLAPREVRSRRPALSVAPAMVPTVAGLLDVSDVLIESKGLVECGLQFRLGMGRLLFIDDWSMAPGRGER